MNNWAEIIDLFKNEGFTYIARGSYGVYFRDKTTKYGVKVSFDMQNNPYIQSITGIREFANHINAYEWFGSKTAKPLFIEFRKNFNMIYMEHVEFNPCHFRSSYSLINRIIDEYRIFIPDIHDNNVIWTDKNDDDYKLIDWGLGFDVV